MVKKILIGDELPPELQGGSTPAHLEKMGFKFEGPYGDDYLVYSHKALGNQRVFYKKNFVDGVLSLEFKSIQ